MLLLFFSYTNSAKLRFYPINKELFHHSYSEIILYIWRDSFTEAMAPYIAANFNESYMRHFNTYSYEDLAKQDPDIVVYEVVEGNIDQLGSFHFQ